VQLEWHDSLIHGKNRFQLPNSQDLPTDLTERIVRFWLEQQKKSKSSVDGGARGHLFFQAFFDLALELQIRQGCACLEPQFGTDAPLEFVAQGDVCPVHNAVHAV
jgi:hypothetical protein